MNRKLSVAIHEASHWTIGKLVGLPVKGIELTQDKETNEPIGITLTGFGDPIPERKEKGTYWRMLESYRWIPFRSGGLIAECIANSKKDFWAMNTKKLLLESQDCQGLYDLYKAENIPQEEFKSLLEMTNTYLKNPVVWGWVNFLANRLLQTTGVYQGNMVDLELRGKPKSPEYDGKPFIEWLLGEIYR